MKQRILDWFSFRLERIVLSGTLGRLTLMGGIILLISTVAGLLGLWFAPDLKSASEAIWWAFLRLTDPGYLGDDQGRGKRAISTALTILGLAVFVGGLVAIVTQWLNETVRRLERGVTPVSLEDHVVILGWTDRTIGIVRELLRSQDRARRFLQLHRRWRLSIVVLIEDLNADRMHEFRGLMGPDWDRDAITLRSGLAMRPDHLRRVDFLRAAAIIIPGADFSEGGHEEIDTRTIKTILSIDHSARATDREELPTLVAEIYDSRKAAVTRRAYRGRVELLASDRVTASLLAQNTRHRYLSYISRELLTQEGNEVYIRHILEMVGRHFYALSAAFPHAVPIGVISPVEEPDGRMRWRTELCPPRDYVLGREDHLVFICESYEECAPLLEPHEEVFEVPESLTYEEEPPPTQKILVLGWGHMLPTLLEELDGFDHQHHEVHVMTLVSMDDRSRTLRSYGLDLSTVEVRHYEGDFTQTHDLERIDVGQFDQIIMLASEWVGDPSKSDARTIVGFLLVQELLGRLPEEHPHPKLLVELTDEANQELLQDKDVEVLVSAVLEGHMLAQVALRPELRTVFDTLFGSRPPLFDFRPASTYEGIVDTEVSFEQLQEVARRYGEIAIGVRVDPITSHDHGVAHHDEAGSVILNPGRASNWQLGPRDDLIVILNKMRA